MQDHTWVIANPAAGRGAAGNTLGDIKRQFALRGYSHFGATKEQGDEERLTAAALREGARTIVVVGGDGTCTRIANETIARSSSCRIAVFPAGTGNDFAKTLGVRKFTVSQLCDLLDKPDSARIDVGRVDGRCFLNSCGFGFDAAVLEASTSVTFLKGDAVYIYSALRQLFTYRGLEVSVGNESRTRMLMVTVSNGQYLGGAFHIAPTASVTDGKLDFAFFRDCNVVQRARLFAGAMKGTHLGLAAVRSEKRAQITLNFSTPPTMEVDGELRHATASAVSLECVPRALSVVAAPGALP